MSASPWVKWYAGDFLNGVADMEPNQIAVYAIVLNRIYDNQGPIPDDVDKIARRCNMRPTTCKKVIETLVESGKLIRRDGVISNSRCEKEIESRSKLAQKSSENAQHRWSNRPEKASENNDDAMQEHMPNECETDAYQKPEARDYIESSPPINPPIESEFDEFWEAYPRHIAKPAALRAFKGARKKVPLADILSGVERYKATKPDYADWCHAATWLNQDRWADDYGEPPKRDGPAMVDWDAVAARNGVN